MEDITQTIDVDSQTITNCIAITFQGWSQVCSLIQRIDSNFVQASCTGAPVPPPKTTRKTNNGKLNETLKPTMSPQEISSIASYRPVSDSRVEVEFTKSVLNPPKFDAEIPLPSTMSAFGQVIDVSSLQVRAGV